MKNRYFLFLGFGLGLIAALIVGTLVIQRPYTYQGSLIEPPAPAPDFALTKPDGTTYRLSQQRGKVVLIFFGYTHCPDICPATLSVFKQVRQQLGARAAQVDFVFITVDPQRDTPQAIGAYLALFDPAIIGLSGNATEAASGLGDLEAVKGDYGVVATTPTPDALGNQPENYEVTHTARTYVIDKQGNLRLTYPFGFSKDGIVQDIAHLLGE